MTQNIDDNTKNNGSIEVSSKLLMMLMVGIAVVIIGIFLVVLASALSGGSTSSGIVIFIGPIPIVFGAGPDAAWLIATGIAISVVMIVVFVLIRRSNYGIL